MDTRNKDASLPATVSVTIQDVTFPGRGVGRLDDGRVIFVDGALAGEVVDVAITREHKRFAEGRLSAVTTASASRIDPVCPLAAKGVCPGCTYQHVAYEEELRIKSAQLESLLQRIGHIETPVMAAPVGSPSPLGYRNKITLHTGRKRGGKALGYLGYNNRSIVNVTACPLAMEPIQSYLDALRADAGWLKSLPRDARVYLRYSPVDGTFWWHEHAPYDGPRMLTERTVLGELTVPRTGFFQVNPALADCLLQQVEETLAELKPQYVIDAFCGVGIFALAAARAGVPEVAGFDLHSEAIGCARTNARNLGLDGCSFFAAPAQEAFERLTPAASTVLILDPPRAGLEAPVLDRICALEPAHILYISCAPDTLSRDVRHLCEKGGFTQVRSQVFDMFARTSAFESLTLLSREPLSVGAMG